MTTNVPDPPRSDQQIIAIAAVLTVALSLAMYSNGCSVGFTKVTDWSPCSDTNVGPAGRAGHLLPFLCASLSAAYSEAFCVCLSVQSVLSELQSVFLHRL